MTSGLEDRLRSMILNNVDAPSQLSPNSSSATTVSSPKSAHAQNLPHSGALQQPQKTSKKRPNQAQRRLMSAQLSIPIDPRPLPPQPIPRAARQYSSPPGKYNNQPSSPYNKSSRPHSVTFRPPVQSGNFDPALSSGTPHATSPNNWRSQSAHPEASLSLSLRNSRSSNHSHYNPRGHTYTRSDNQFSRVPDADREAALLDQLCNTVVAGAEIEPSDIAEKEAFRQRIELICREVISNHENSDRSSPEFEPETITLCCFGSLSSGFATKASDMDLGLLSPRSHPQPDAPESPIPRLIEKAFLDAGMGARLLTRTRVPIIKLCEQPSEELRRGLLDAREKWEQGITNDMPDGLDEDLHEDADGHHDTDFKEGGHGEGANGSSASAQITDAEARQHKLGSLKQTENQSLSGYYQTAKRLLRRLGARDVTHSNIREFVAEDFQILTDLCRAYVRGLSDHELRQRLGLYASCSFPEPTSPAKARSLAGVHSQIEGEKLVMAWDRRIIRERNMRVEEECQRLITAWQDLQQRQSYGFEPLAYNKELQLSLEKLRKIPSIQLKLLEQGQYETAADYHSRTTKILTDLGGNDERNCPILPYVINHFIDGVRIDSIRTSVMEFACPLEGTTLRAVARRLKTLQLAMEYEKAIEKGLYRDDQVPSIREYVQVLQAPLRKRSMEGGHVDSVVPLPKQSALMLSAVCALPDPSTMACNQPRDQYHDALAFPKAGVGVQCDINFSAHLALQNTLLLRCYSHTDRRVRPLVLFVKHWAKVRNINTPYRGTLSSYGYVLMMLHYLVNIAEPFVCPNLQELARPPDPSMSPSEVEGVSTCKGRDVRFWRNEDEIKQLAAQDLLNQNRDSIGHLLRGFFEYYAERGIMRDNRHRGFDWGRDVLSLRTHGGLMTKQQKGWTGAKTVVQVQTQTLSSISRIGSSPSDSLQSASADPPRSYPAAPAEGPPKTHPHRQGEVKEVRHRYLFAIEDPFEHDHNVARTVTHNGIVSIRDEFRRAWRIIQDAGRGKTHEDLLQDAKAGCAEEERVRFSALIQDIHGIDIAG